MKKGDIILVPFYFTDFSNYKLRPSLIVSYGQSTPGDYIAGFISTIISLKEPRPTHFITSSNNDHFFKTGFKKASVLKCNKLMTINESISGTIRRTTGPYYKNH